MAAVAALVLNDGQVSPEAHTFTPLGPDANGVWWFEDQSAAAAIGYNRISFDLRRPMTAKPGESSSNRVYRCKIGIHVPVLENTTNSTVSGVAPAPTLSYINRVNIEFIVPERSALAARKDSLAYARDLITKALITDAVESLTGVW